jgi:hypothetical protein
METGKRFANTGVDKTGHLKANTLNADKESSSMIVNLKFLKSKAEKAVCKANLTKFSLCATDCLNFFKLISFQLYFFNAND